VGFYSDLAIFWDNPLATVILTIHPRGIPFLTVTT